MKTTPEVLVGIVIVLLIVAGGLYYEFAAPHAVAPTTSTTTPVVAVSTTTTSQSTSNPMLRTYTDPNKVFAFDYPGSGAPYGSTAGYSQDWMVNATANGLVLVKVAFPAALQPQTNFVGATFSVGTSPVPAAVAQCLTTPQSGGGPAQKSLVTIGGVQYTRYTESDAGAGNFYSTVSYRTIRNGQCYAIEYTIHSSNIGNYSPDQHISQFDQTKIDNMLEAVVHSFKFL